MNVFTDQENELYRLYGFLYQVKDNAKQTEFIKKRILELENEMLATWKYTSMKATQKELWELKKFFKNNNRARQSYPYFTKRFFILYNRIALHKRYQFLAQ